MAGEDDARDGAAPDDRTPAPPPAGPAPIIDLGGDAVPVRPVKPLGPRRLARLQRELAERTRELEEAGGSPGDPELLEKQRRFAELAAQAGAAQADPGTGTAVQEPVVPETAAPGSAPSSSAPGPSAPPEDQQELLEQITVVFPDGGGPGGPDGHVSHDPVHVDPALFSNRLAPEDLAALTHIEIVAPTDAEHHGSHASTSPAPVAGHEEPGHADDPPAAPPEPAPEPAGSWADDEPPAAPVLASTAEGLELLEPREYRRRASSAWWVLLLAVLAALAVVLVLFVL
ncbi:hypothetical protein [Kocuria arenosa]|uniref:hypothetical protein n=1 Tax=Kocuria arenosa TaxID=3071446 RepID=UPI0034D6E759